MTKEIIDKLEKKERKMKNKKGGAVLTVILIILLIIVSILYWNCYTKCRAGIGFNFFNPDYKFNISKNEFNISNLNPFNSVSWRGS